MAAALERALGPALPGEGSEAPLPPLPVLVLGPAGSGRTSLLLRTALAGGADGPRVLFLAPSAIPRLPGGPGGTGTDPRALQRLSLRYPRSVPSLCAELVSLSRSLVSPSPPRAPSLVLLDGLERYLGPSPRVPARVAALLLELTAVPRRVPSVPPQVVAALRLPPPSPQALGTLLRFFPARCHLGPARVTLRCPGMAPRRWRLCLGDTHGDNAGDRDSDSDSEEEWE